jgi:ElaA protein
MNWLLKKFDELTVHELYAILQLRNEVFAVEQNCVYRDMDDKDQQSWHLMGWSKEESPGKKQLAAYTRILPPGLSYPEASIGRVVTAAFARGQGAGRSLMERSIEELYNLFGKVPVRIGAQYYLLGFYNSLGFVQSSAIYDEDGIDHIEMLLA